MLVVGTLAYAASYFARGWLAGHKYFGLYGGLVLMESISRVCFALAVAIGIASGQTAVALGIAAAPFVSLIVVPSAFARRNRELEPPSGGRGARASRRRRRRRLDAAGPAAEGIEEAVEAAGDLSLRGGIELRLLGLGDHALRADAAERRRAHRGGDGDRTTRSRASSSTCC